jgi:hypothetical protein
MAEDSLILPQNPAGSSYGGTRVLSDDSVLLFIREISFSHPCSRMTVGNRCMRVISGERMSARFSFRTVAEREIVISS